jgi:hypothetical protein
MGATDRKTVTAERLRELLHYNPETGVFTRVARVRGARIGDAAGSVKANGYIRIRIDRGLYFAHRLAWLYMTGEWPDHHLDHRDGDRANNRFDNLRAATPAENHQNRAMPKTNTSGFVGAHFDRKRRRWSGKIRVSGRLVHLGFFDTPEAAHAAYLSAKARFHKFQPVPRPAPSAPALREVR